MSLIAILNKPPVSVTSLSEVNLGQIRLTVVDHGNILFFCRTLQMFPPIELNPLSTMQIQQFICLPISISLRQGEDKPLMSFILSEGMTLNIC